MLNFILNPLKELFSMQGDEPVFDSESKHYSYKKAVSLEDFNKVYTLKGNIVYSLSDFKYFDDTRDIFYKLKYKVRDEEVNKFLDFISEEMALIMNSNKIDYIVKVPSSSIFLQKVIDFTKNRYNIPEASFVNIKKTPIEQLKFNKRSPALEGYDRDEVKELQQQVMKHINYQIEDGNEYLEAKRFPKQLLSLITGFFQVSGDAQALKGKKVLIIDDSYASGNTIKDIVDMFSTQFDCTSIGLVLFTFKA